MIELLEKRESQPKTGIGTTFHEIAERIKRRGLILVLSDLFGDPDDILRGLQHFRHNRHEVVVFHILDRDELTFPFKDAARFEGMEGEEPLTAEPNCPAAILSRGIRGVCGQTQKRLPRTQHGL